MSRTKNRSVVWRSWPLAREKSTWRNEAGKVIVLAVLSVLTVYSTNTKPHKNPERTTRRDPFICSTQKAVGVLASSQPLSELDNQEGAKAPSPWELLPFKDPRCFTTTAYSLPGMQNWHLRPQLDGYYLPLIRWQTQEWRRGPQGWHGHHLKSFHQSTNSGQREQLKMHAWSVAIQKKQGLYKGQQWAL